MSQTPARRRALRILHVTNSFCADGTGITNVVADLALTQADGGHEVAIACAEADEPMRGLAETHGVRVWSDLGVTFPYAIVRGVWRLSRLIAAEHFDVVHVHTARATGLVLIAAPVSLRGRSVSTIHNQFQRSAVAMCITTAVVCVSEVDARSIRARSRRNPWVVHNGNLDSPRVDPLADVIAAPLAPSTVVFAGGMHKRKGVDVLLRAMVRVVDEHPDAQLCLLGNRDNAAVERLASQLGLDGVAHFVGFQRDPRAYMLAASVFVLPSRAEPFGLVLVEARACGVPVVASNVGGIPEALSGGRAGLLVPPEDVDALAQTISAILTDHDLAADLRARTQVGLEAFTVAKMVTAYEQVYASL